MAIITQPQPFLIADTLAEINAIDYPNHSLFYAIDVNKFFKTNTSSLIPIGGSGYVSSMIGTYSYLPLVTNTTKGVVPAIGTPSGKFLKDDLTWSSPAGSGDMVSTSNLSDVANIVTARNNILPSKVGNSLKLLRVNVGETDYELFTLSGGGDMLKSDNLSGLANYTTTRSNLGLGTLATQNGTFSGTFSGTSSGNNTGDQDLSGLVPITRTINGSALSGNITISTITGNAGTATTLQTTRTIGGVNFDGTANIVPQTIQSVNEATDITCFPLFISASGSQSLQPLNNAGFIYNSNTNSLTATTFIGALTGIASGNLVSGGALGTPSSGTLTNCTFPTLNQSTTGSAATLTTPRAINGTNFDGSAAITVTAAAGTLTGTTLNATVVTSSLTTIGTLITGAIPTTLLTGVLATAQHPALTGDITTSAGSLATTIKTSVTLVTPIIGVATGTSLAVTGLLTSSGTAGIGYATGAGGTVTQATSRTTGVTLSKITGAITTNTTSLAALAVATFTVTNTLVAATDVIKVCIKSGAVNVKTDVRVTAVAAGSFNITVHNIDASTAETGAIIINFVVIKGVTA